MTKEIKNHLRSIEFLLAGIILKKKVNLKQIAKIIGVSDKKLTELFPEKIKKKKDNPKSKDGKI